MKTDARAAATIAVADAADKAGYDVPLHLAQDIADAAEVARQADLPEYPAAQVGKLLEDALSGVGRRGPRRTRREAAADRVVDAIAALVAEGVEDGDVVALEGARAAAERYRRADA